MIPSLNHGVIFMHFVQNEQNLAESSNVLVWLRENGKFS